MKKSTRYNVLIALTYSITLIGGMFMGYKFLKDQGYQFQRTTHYADNNAEKVDEIIHIINKNYVDEVNADSLNHLPIDSLLHQLDPHSIYLPPAKANEFAETLGGNFAGIGIEYYILNDTLLVTNVFKDGPAFLAGIKQGDKILKIDTVFVSGKALPREKMIGKIKGREGTPVRLIVMHPGAEQPVVLNIKRERVKVSSIDASYMLNAETGYVRISKFGAETDKDFIESIRSLKAKGMKKLVLDLRDNGGGYLTAATGLANQILEENKLIVYTEGKHEPRTDYVATGGGEFEDGKLAVLINENSASASEILAGAVQDLNRGIIIGRRSFGKGLVQEQFPFGDGSALNLTIARYYTPSGRSIQKSYKKGYKAYQNEIEERFTDGELTSGKISKKDSLNSKAFIGGGIQPDIYIKMDTAGYNKLYYTLVSKKVLFDFVYDVLASRYTASFIEQNMAAFSINDADFKDFIRYAQGRNVVVDPKQLAVAKPVLLSDIKVLLCKYHLGDAGYYKALNLSDAMIKQAITSLQ
ncbi:S41 family peptidase [Pedobacter metabolipauper]|uniref:Carboxyl-terminal processing protease n=1 Tax=Pedobacter metabolipauper TaxID=425513 RepID=A0A4R6SXC0_9SPHI|nr:S41 family peptidase [Pedobacter metabolipauper]TDQ10111.1 carboxyl-terminal processing protease [Pedobacter metabolipauper]